MIGSTRLALAFGIAVAMSAVLGTASIAQAQYQAPPPPGYYAPPPPRYAYPPPRYAYPPPPQVYRQGLTIGVGLGLGGTAADTCGDACGGGFAYDFHIGGMLTPQLALLFDISGVMHSIPNSSIDTYNTMYLAALQFFPINALWFKAGLGLAHYTETDIFTGDQGDDTGKAVMIAAGYEVYQSGPFAIDLSLNLGQSFYSVAKDHGTLAFLVGFNWY